MNNRRLLPLINDPRFISMKRQLEDLEANVAMKPIIDAAQNDINVDLFIQALPLNQQNFTHAHLAAALDAGLGLHNNLAGLQANQNNVQQDLDGVLIVAPGNNIASAQNRLKALRRLQPLLVDPAWAPLKDTLSAMANNDALATLIAASNAPIDINAFAAALNPPLTGPRIAAALDAGLALNTLAAANGHDIPAAFIAVANAHIALDKLQTLIDDPRLDQLKTTLVALANHPSISAAIAAPGAHNINVNAFIAAIPVPPTALDGRALAIALDAGLGIANGALLPLYNAPAPQAAQAPAAQAPQTSAAAFNAVVAAHHDDTIRTLRALRSLNALRTDPGNAPYLHMLDNFAIHKEISEAIVAAGKEINVNAFIGALPPHPTNIDGPALALALDRGLGTHAVFTNLYQGDQNHEKEEFDDALTGPPDDLITRETIKTLRKLHALSTDPRFAPMQATLHALAANQQIRTAIVAAGQDIDVNAFIGALPVPPAPLDGAALTAALDAGLGIQNGALAALPAATFNPAARMAKLSAITEPALRAALISYANVTPNFDPSLSEIANFNTQISGLPALPAITAVALDTVIQNVWPGNPPNPVNYFQNAGAPALNGIIAEHTRLAPLYDIPARYNAVRDALIHFTAHNNAWAPSVADVTNMVAHLDANSSNVINNTLLSTLVTGPYANGKHANPVVPADAARTASNYFQNAGAPLVHSANHAQLRMQHLFSLPPRYSAVRDALTAFAAADGHWAPDPIDVKAMTAWLDRNSTTPITHVELASLVNNPYGGPLHGTAAAGPGNAAAFFQTAPAVFVQLAEGARIRMQHLFAMPAKYSAVRDALATFANADGGWQPSAADVTNMVADLDANPKSAIDHRRLSAFVTGPYNNGYVPAPVNAPVNNIGSPLNYFENVPAGKALVAEAETVRNNVLLMQNIKPNAGKKTNDALKNITEAIPNATLFKIRTTTSMEGTMLEDTFLAPKQPLTQEKLEDLYDKMEVALPLISPDHPLYKPLKQAYTSLTDPQGIGTINVDNNPPTEAEWEAIGKVLTDLDNSIKRFDDKAQLFTSDRTPSAFLLKAQHYQAKAKNISNMASEDAAKLDSIEKKSLGYIDELNHIEAKLTEQLNASFILESTRRSIDEKIDITRKAKKEFSETITYIRQERNKPLTDKKAYFKGETFDIVNIANLSVATLTAPAGCNLTRASDGTQLRFNAAAAAQGAGGLASNTDKSPRLQPGQGRLVEATYAPQGATPLVVKSLQGVIDGKYQSLLCNDVNRQNVERLPSAELNQLAWDTVKNYLSLLPADQAGEPMRLLKDTPSRLAERIVMICEIQQLKIHYTPAQLPEHGLRDYFTRGSATKAEIKSEVNSFIKEYEASKDQNKALTTYLKGHNSPLTKDGLDSESKKTRRP